MEISLKNAKEFGVFFRADGTADEGSFVSCQPGRSRVSLYTLRKRFKNPNAGVIYTTRPRVTIQENYFVIAPGETFSFRVIAFGPYVEFSMNGRVLLSAITCPRKSGLLGVFAEDGTVELGNHRVRRLTAPDE